MKKILALLLFVVLSFTMIACSKKQVSTTEDVIKFIEEKGKDNVDWKDFEHLERLKEEERVYDSIANVYKLDDGAELILTGNGYENKPLHINIIDGEKNINLK
ncbi:hypothetical protein [uncultured Helcococcus sp.]|uniref:hypothetical protein n=1 Tax=uncultured Helcococcus sp. TaxID=1072508 RepID=UPI00288AF5E7|nr:hypothetical protein [uncultured Helcococcus sp.]